MECWTVGMQESWSYPHYSITPFLSPRQLKARQLDLRIIRLLEHNLDAVAHFHFFFRLSHQAALDDHAFIEDYIDVVNRRLVFECRIARHADEREGVNLTGAFSFDPIQLAETIDAGDARKKLHLAAAFALLQQKLAVGRARPERLIDFIYFGQTFLRHSCFSHYFLL